MWDRARARIRSCTMNPGHRAMILYWNSKRTSRTNLLVGGSRAGTQTYLNFSQRLSTFNRSTLANYREASLITKPTIIWAGLENLIPISRALLVILVSHQFVNSLLAGCGCRDGCETKLLTRPPQINPTHHRSPVSYNRRGHYPGLPSPPKRCKGRLRVHQNWKATTLGLQVS